MNRTIRMAGLALGAATAMAASATAQNSYSTNFESFSGSSSGVLVTGQDGFYLPSGSWDFYCYTYAGNAVGVVAHPTGGGEKFIAGQGQGGTLHARAQRDLAFANGVYDFKYDNLCDASQTVPGAQNIGSFSLQPAGTADFIHLFSWEDINNPVGYQALYLVYNAAGVMDAQPGRDPGPEWNNLKRNNWYRHTSVVNFIQNRVTSVSIEDLHTGAKATVNPTDWYLRGGEAGGFPLPTGFRFFAGAAAVPLNMTAWDNISYVAQLVTCYADCDKNGRLDIRDFFCFQAQYAGGCP